MECLILRVETFRSTRNTFPSLWEVVPFISDVFEEMGDQKNLESYYLFWLDTTVRAPEFMEAEDELRSIINYVKIFESSAERQREFSKITNSIPSLSLLSTIHNHKQLHSIYIYHNDNNTSLERTVSHYKKVFYL